MQFRRTTLLTLALTGALTVTAACGDKTDDTATPGLSGSASASAKVDAKTELSEAFNKLAGTPSKFTLKTDMGSLGSVTGTGASDPVNKASTGSIAVTAQGQNITTETIVVGTDVYLKMGLSLPGLDPKKWTHIDGTKVSSLSKLGISDPADPANVKTFSNSVVTVEKTGDGAFKGTMDVTKRAGGGTSAAMIQQMGDAAKSVPFEAAVNADGYPTSLTIKMPAAGQVPASTTVTSFSDFGKAVTVTKPPAAQTQEAPPALLAQLG